MSESENDLKQQYELQALFDLSKALNSSLNLRTILDTLLLTPMGKMLIGKGVVMISLGKNKMKVETLKGINRTLEGTTIEVADLPQGPTYVQNLPPSDWGALLAKNAIEVVVPILHDGHELGMIGFGKKSLGAGYNESDLDYLHSLGNIAATAIQNAIIFKELNESNRKLEKKIQELNTLSEIEKELNSTLSTLETEKVVNLLAYSIMGELMVNKCLICLAEDGKLTLGLNRGIQLETTEVILSDPLCNKELLDLQRPVILDGSEASPALARLVAAELAVVVPMRLESECKGLIALGQKITKLPFVPDEIDFLSMLGNWSMVSIETARLIEQEVEKKKLEQELQIASEIQRQLLPATLPKIPGFQIAGVNIPSLQVGGDYYDCLQINENEYIFCIADVSGKGAPAALLMSNLQASLHALVDAGMSLSQITERINNIIHRNTTFDKFITFFLGRLNVSDRTFTSVNAGHNPPYLFHANKDFQLLEEGGLILGVMRDVPFKCETTKLVSGDCLVLFTDGVSEAMNVADEEFEEHRIEACISQNHESSAQVILDRLIDAVREFSTGCSQADDITVVTIKVE